MVKIKTIKDLKEQDTEDMMIKDCLNRINDWLSYGGLESDLYIQKQLQFAEKYINAIDKKVR